MSARIVPIDHAARKAAEHVDAVAMGGAEPVHRHAAEDAVLNALVLRHVKLTDVQDILIEPALFFTHEHQLRYAAICQLHEAGETIEVESVARTLADRHGAVKRGDYEREQSRAMRDAGERWAVMTVKAIRERAEKIRDAWVRRRAAAVLIEGTARAYHLDEDFGAELERRTEELTALRGLLVTKATGITSKAASVSLARAMRETAKPAGFSLGPRLSKLNTMLRGLRPQKVTVIGARTSIGKSILAMQMAIAVAEQGAGVYIASLEMSAEDLAARAAAHIGQVDSSFQFGIRVPGAERIIPALNHYSSLPIQVYPSQTASLDQILAGAMEYKRELNRAGKSLGLLVVDHIGLPVSTPAIEARGDSQARAIYNSRKLRGLAEALDCHVLAPAQINRKGVEFPSMAHLKDSGNLEADTDNVLLIHRPAMKDNPDLPDPDAQARIIVPKNRSGPKGEVFAWCNPACHTFTEVES